MKILVIGGAGYIGSHVCLELMERGHDVTVFDNMSSGSHKNIFPKETFIQGDILNAQEIEAAARGGFDGAVHLAAFKAAGESMLLPEKYAVNNISGTVNILNAVCKAGIRHFVFSSSAAVYGEPAYLPIDEKHQTLPENFYGFTKLEIERMLGWYAKLKGLTFTALRYFNAAGYDVRGRVRGLETNPANLLPVIMEVAAGKRDSLKIFGTDYPTQDGTCIRDYVHVNDLAAAHAAAFDYMHATGKNLIANLGSEEGLSVLDILAAARRITGKTIPADNAKRREGDPAKLVASSALAAELLGFKARYSDPDTLVSSTWNAYKNALH